MTSPVFDWDTKPLDRREVAALDLYATDLTFSGFRVFYGEGACLDCPSRTTVTRREGCCQPEPARGLRARLRARLKANA